MDYFTSNHEVDLDWSADWSSLEETQAYLRYILLLALQPNSHLFTFFSYTMHGFIVFNLYIMDEINLSVVLYMFKFDTCLCEMLEFVFRWSIFHVQI